MGRILHLGIYHMVRWFLLSINYFCWLLVAVDTLTDFSSRIPFNKLMAIKGLRKSPTHTALTPTQLPSFTANYRLLASARKFFRSVSFRFIALCC